MWNGRRTDLAVEAMELARAAAVTQLPGVLAREEDSFGYSVTTVEILDEAGEAALGKPRGRYVTLHVPALCGGGRADCSRAAEAVAAELSKLLKLEAGAPVLVAGLGNRAVTPDALGPKTVDALLVTRHLTNDMLPCSALRPVAALAEACGARYVTPRTADRDCALLAKTLGLAISRALQPGLTREELLALL